MSAAWLILISLVLNRCRVNGFGKETGGIICSANSAGNGNSLNLTLLASNNFSNAGLISSSGSLTVNAGGTINNVATSSNNFGVPVLQAANSVTLSSAAGSITNNGVISAQSGLSWMPKKNM